MKQTTAQYKTYDYRGWEGGIAVFGMKGDHGVTVIAIPRFNLSVAIVNETDYFTLYRKLREIKSFTADEANEFANLISQDFRKVG